MIQPEVVSQKTKKTGVYPPPPSSGKRENPFIWGGIFYAFIALDNTTYICCWTPFLRHMKFANSREINTDSKGLQPHRILEKQKHSICHVPFCRHLNSLCFSDGHSSQPLGVDRFIQRTNKSWERSLIEIYGDNTYVVDGSFEIRRCQNHRTESIRHPQVNNGIFPARVLDFWLPSTVLLQVIKKEGILNQPGKCLIFFSQPALLQTWDMWSHEIIKSQNSSPQGQISCISRQDSPSTCFFSEISTNH